MIEEVIAQSAVVPRCTGWDPEYCKGGVIFAGYIGIETSVVLFEIRMEWTAGAVFSDISDGGREPAANAGVGAVDPGEVLRTQSGGEGRSNVDAPSRDVFAIYACCEPGSIAVCSGDERAENSCPRETQIC